MPLVGVIPHLSYRGLCAPGYINPRYPNDTNPTYDWREPPHSELNTAGIEPIEQVTDLTNALNATYDTPALFSCYILRDVLGSPCVAQPRVNKNGREWLLSQGYSLTIEVFAADIDNPKKRRWDGQSDLLLLDLVERLSATPNIGFYLTPSGSRIVQPLKCPLPAGEESELSASIWLQSMANTIGVEPDWSCKDWTRHYYLPHAQRDNKPYRSLILDLSRMRPIDPPIAKGASVARGAFRSIAGLQYPRHAPQMFEHLIESVSAPLRSGGYQGHRHGIYLSLAGALLMRDVPPEFVPGIVTDIARAGGAKNPEHHRRSALDTIAEWASGRRVKGRAGLPPDVRAAFDIACAGRKRSRAPVVGATSNRPALTLAKGSEAMVTALRNARAGLTVIRTPCGLGKTSAACGIAQERAQKTKGPRTPKTRTAIAVPTHEKAKELLDTFKSHGVPAKRIYGQLSLKYETGEPVCRHYDTAKHIQAGGLSVPWEFCDGRGVSPCTFRESCAAYSGFEGDGAAKITLGPHALIDKLSGAAGASGLLIVDETPQLTRTERISESNLVLTETLLILYEDAFAESMREVIASLRSWLATAPIDKPMTLREALGSVDRSIINEYKGPPVKFEYAIEARRDITIAKGIGHSSHVLRCIYDLVCRDTAAMMVDNARCISVTTVPLTIEESLKRDGSVVLLDASASVHEQLYRKICTNVSMLEIDVADRSLVERRILYTINATRGRNLHWTGKLSEWIALVVEWLRKDSLTLDVVIVSTLYVEGFITKCLRERAGDAYDSLSLLPKPPELAHYGELRGLNYFEEFDAIVTIGDPWQSVPHVINTATIAGIDPRPYSEALARAELQQAHGRIRTIHRTRRSRMLHVGALMPLGWEHEKVDVEAIDKR